jgi:leucyl/phenylalanyl-tRNA--protein transferase
MRRGHLKVTADLAFAEVVRGCRTVARGKIPGVQSWINDEIEEVFARLHRFGHAHSIETWRDGELVGGLCGVAVGQVFVGYSMFHREAHASKVALVRLSEKLDELGFPLIDCQVMNPHLKRMGAQLMPRDQFTAIVAQASRGVRELGLWTSLFTTNSRVGV